MPSQADNAATVVQVPNEHDAMPEHGLITREHAFVAAQNAVRNQGYAVARHGSTVRDLDLIAVPWEDTVLTPKDVAEIIADAIPGVVHWPFEKRAHGRLAVVIYPRWVYGFDRWYVDLSIMPRRRKRAA